jgi:iron complex transport system ATP-binding protein
VVASGPIGTTLTAEALEQTFDVPLVLERHDERWTARAKA